MAENSTTVFALSLITAKPDHLMALLNMLPTGQRIFEKHGAKQLGVWLTETGEMSKIVRLVEWPSMDKRMACMSRRFTDSEMSTYFDKVAKMYTHLETFICREDRCVPMGHFSPTTPIWIKRFTPNRSEPLATQKIREMAHVVGELFAEDCSLTALLHPIYYSDRCLFTMWQMKDGHKWDRVNHNAYTHVRNPDHFQQLEECRDAFTMCRSVICTPVQFDKLPRAN
jgi:hypothetical protein